MDPFTSKQLGSGFNQFAAQADESSLRDCVPVGQSQAPSAGEGFSGKILNTLMEIFNLHKNQEQPHELIHGSSELRSDKPSFGSENLSLDFTSGSTILKSSSKWEESTIQTLSVGAFENPLQLEALSERWQIYLAIIYSLTAITSFVLNAITVVVLSRYRGSELRKYLINLSMSDLLMSLFSIRK